MANVFSKEIDTYDPNTGALLSVVSGAGVLHGTSQDSFENEAQIATDSAGNVYVPNVPENKVLEYSPSPVCSANRWNASRSKRSRAPVRTL